MGNSCLWTNLRARLQLIKNTPGANYNWIWSSTGGPGLGAGRHAPGHAGGRAAHAGLLEVVRAARDALRLARRVLPDGTALPLGLAHFLEHKMFATPDGDVFDLYAKRGASRERVHDLRAHGLPLRLHVALRGEPRHPARHARHHARRRRRASSARRGSSARRSRCTTTTRLARPLQPAGRALPRPPVRHEITGTQGDDRGHRPRRAPRDARGLLPPAQPRAVRRRRRGPRGGPRGASARLVTSVPGRGHRRAAVPEPAAPASPEGARRSR